MLCSGYAIAIAIAIPTATAMPIMAYWSWVLERRMTTLH